MTRLRQIMLEELTRRNYAERTAKLYIQHVAHFARYFKRSPDQLGPEHIRKYQAALFTKWKLSPTTVTQRLAALRFFYIQVLKRRWSLAETPTPRKYCACLRFSAKRKSHSSLTPPLSLSIASC